MCRINLAIEKGSVFFVSFVEIENPNKDQNYKNEVKER